MRATNATTHAVDLESGRVLAPGETGDVDRKSDHDSALLDTRQLVEAETPAEPKTSRKPAPKQEDE